MRPQLTANVAHSRTSQQVPKHASLAVLEAPSHHSAPPPPPHPSPPPSGGSQQRTVEGIRTKSHGVHRDPSVWPYVGCVGGSGSLLRIILRSSGFDMCVPLPLVRPIPSAGPNRRWTPNTATVIHLVPILHVLLYIAYYKRQRFVDDAPHAAGGLASVTAVEGEAGFSAGGGGGQYSPQKLEGGGC